MGIESLIKAQIEKSLCNQYNPLINQSFTVIKNIVFIKQ